MAGAKPVSPGEAEVVLSIERGRVRDSHGSLFTGFRIRTSKRTCGFYADEQYYGASIFYFGSTGPGTDEVAMLGECVLSGLKPSCCEGSAMSSDGDIFELGNLRTASMVTTAGTITIGCWKRTSPRELLLADGGQWYWV